MIMSYVMTMYTEEQYFAVGFAKNLFNSKTYAFIINGFIGLCVSTLAILFVLCMITFIRTLFLSTFSNLWYSNTVVIDVFKPFTKYLLKPSRITRYRAKQSYRVKPCNTYPWCNRNMRHRDSVVFHVLV